LEVVWVIGVLNLNGHLLSSFHELGSDNSPGLVLLLRRLHLIRFCRIHTRGFLRHVSCPCLKRFVSEVDVRVTSFFSALISIRRLVFSNRLPFEQLAPQGLASFFLKLLGLAAVVLLVFVHREIQLDVQSGDHGGLVGITDMDVEVPCNTFGEMLAEEEQLSLS